MSTSPEPFDSLNYSDYSEYSEYSNTLNQVEHFESVRLSVELEGVVGLKIEFNALECPGGNMSWVIQITNTPELLVTLNCSGGNMNELINVSVGWRC